MTGPVGATGPQGIKGDAGPVGPFGPQGLKGDVGPIGPQGLKGDTGMTGAAGPQGLKGDTGLTGPAGASGPQGATALTGSTGPVGPAGPQGLKGDAGLTGPAGATGPQGPMGQTGPQGPAGLTGPTGPMGPYGATGAPGATGSPGAQGPAGIPGNRTSRVATMQWWKSINYPVGNNPTGIVFDGVNIWVVNQNDSTLTKISARDGKLIGTYPTWVNPGQNASLTFDGTYIYVSSTGRIMKHLASDGSIFQPINYADAWCYDSFRTPNGGMAFDGTNLLQARNGGLVDLHTCLTIDRSFAPGIGAAFPWDGAIATDGTHFWVLGTASNKFSIFTVQNGVANVLMTHPALQGGVGVPSPVALAYGGSTMWVAHSWLDPNAQVTNNGRVVSTGGYHIFGFSPTTLQQLPAPQGGHLVVPSAPTALAFDGTNLWVLSSSGNSVLRMNSTIGFTTFPVGPSPTSIAFDGDNMWVTNSGNNTVTRLPAF